MNDYNKVKLPLHTIYRLNLMAMERGIHLEDLLVKALNDWMDLVDMGIIRSGDKPIINEMTEEL